MQDPNSLWDDDAIAAILSRLNRPKIKFMPAPQETIVLPTQVIRQHNTHELNDQQVSAVVMEKAIEVNRITTKQELARQIKEEKKVGEAIRVKMVEKKKILTVAVINAEEARLRRDPDVKALAKLLSKVLAARVTAAGLIKQVVLSKSRTRHQYTEGIAAFNDLGTHVTIGVFVSMNIQVVATAKEVVDADSDDLDEDYKGRQTIETDGWIAVVPVSREHQTMLREVRTLSEQVEASDNKVLELEERLTRVADQSDALKAQILRKQIEEAPGGATVIALLDSSMAATLEGRYTALL